MGIKNGERHTPKAVVLQAIEWAAGALGEQARVHEASGMLGYVPAVREHREELELFAIQRELAFSPEDLSHTAMQASAVQGGVHSLRGEGMALWAFVHGVAALTTLVEPDEVDRVAQFLMGIAEQIEDRQLFPALDEHYVEDYVMCLERILENGEPSTRLVLLSYNMGVWWFMGHLKRVDQARLKGRRWRGPTIRQFVRDTWLKRIERGVMDEA